MITPFFKFARALAGIALIAIVAGRASADPVAAPISTAAYQYPFQDPSVPTEKRIDNLLSIMTLDEKIACLRTNTAVPRLGIAGTGQMEGLHGLSLGGPRLAGGGGGGAPAPRPPGVAPAAPGANPVPAAGGIPIAGAAGANPPRRRFAPITTTEFPQSIGLGETWDPGLLRKIAAEEGLEARYVAQSPKYNRSSLIVMAPNADLGRDPRWGRTEECYGEDPFFNGTMVVAYVRGLQGADPRYWQTAALLKHFLANSNEDTRASSSSDFDDRLFREYYSVAFRMGIVEGGARAFMASYNSVNGIPMAVSPLLKVTVNEWGQNGIICTDGGAFRQLMTAHNYYPDLAQAAAGTLKAGITKYLDQYQTAVQAALDQHLITESDIDSAIRPNFRILIKLGLLDPPAMVPYSTIGTGPEPWLSDNSKALARQATDESIVLLKNDGLLPLDRSKIKSIAVIGPRAAKVSIDWYGGQPPYSISPLEGITAAVGPGVTVVYAPNNDSNAAARAAASCDVAIVCVGNHPNGGDGQKWGQVSVPSEGREAVDRKSIMLEQEDLVKQVYAANKRTVVALVSSFPYAINWSQEHIPAIVHMTHASQEEGNGLADVLFGDYNPGGRLVQTWPASVRQLPPLLDYDIRHGRTYMYFGGKPLYPFGYGRSYTTFAWTNLHTSASAIDTPGSIAVTVDAKNTGTRAGDDVVELYVKYLDSAVSRPNEQLVGFQRVSLRPGESKGVTILLKAVQLAYWDSTKHSFVVENGKIELRIAHSSADVALTKTIAVRSTSATELISSRGE